MDWRAWHDDYDLPESSLARRLRIVQEQIGLALDVCPPGPLKVLSLCAGQGRDLLGVLADHPRRDDVRARLVELDPANTATAIALAADLEGVEVITGDASLTDQYRGMAPADLVLVCGIFGNLTDEDIEKTIGFCAQLCDTNATVVWTRHREAPDLVPRVCAWFEGTGFERVWVSAPEAGFGVGVHRFTGRPRALVTGERMFRFVGFDRLKAERMPS